MTSPGSGSPDGSIGVGAFAAAQARTEAEAKAAATSGGWQESWNLAQDNFRPSVDGASHIPSLVDGQSALEGRVDLLDTGYCHLIQSKNWTCPSGGSAKKLPFDRKVGPSKDAIPSSNGIRLLKKGLWRADALVCWEPAINYLSSTTIPLNTAGVLAVHRVSDNSLFTRKHFYFTVFGLTDPSSIFWSHEFVVPDDNAYDVSVWVGQSNNLSHAKKLFGGIQYTGLWVTQISSSTDNIQPGETVTDGGTLS